MRDSSRLGLEQARRSASPVGPSMTGLKSGDARRGPRICLTFILIFYCGAAEFLKPGVESGPRVFRIRTPVSLLDVRQVGMRPPRSHALYLQLPVY
jgi:hypothetical protein